MTLLLAIAVSTTLSLASPSPASGGGPNPSGATSPGGFAVGETETSPNAAGVHPGVQSNGVITRTVDCGPVSVEGSPLPPRDTYCGIVHPICDVATPASVPAPAAYNYVTVTTYPDGREVATPACGVTPARGRPQVTGDMARAEAEKLLPHPPIGTAPAGGVSLVNIETVLWVDTQQDLTLGTVTLLGYRVTLRAHLQSVSWNFGDDAIETTSTPGRPYTKADPCTTVDCPQYFGHTYRATGHLTIGARLTWTGQFQVDGGAWQDIPGTVTAPATGQPIHIREARGVLVDNP